MCRMARKKTSFAKAVQASGKSRRSPLHKWLLEQYDSLRDTLNGPAPNWVDAAAAAGLNGQVDAKGQPPSAHTLRMMWARVRREAEAAKASRADRFAKGAPQRSRAQASWQPTVVARPSPPPAVPRRKTNDLPPAPIDPRSRIGMPGTDAPKPTPEEVQTRLAQLRRTFAERSGH